MSAANLNVPAPPWEHNPSAWSQRIPIAILAFVGAGLSAWMAAYQWDLVDWVWDPVWGAESTARVLDSHTSEWMRGFMGMPDAALGFFAYVGDGVLGMAGSTRRWQYRPWMVILFGIDVIPLGIVGAILVFAQGFIVGSFCFLCIVSAIISLVLIVFAYDEVWSSLVYLKRVRDETGSRREVWDAFWGRPSPAAARVATMHLEEAA